MNPLLPFSIQTAGVLQLVIAAANFCAPQKLDYRENLSRVSPIIRQIFTVHSVYIVIVLIGMSLLCLFFPHDLCGTTSLGQCLCGFLTLFWSLRVILQFFYYDRATKEKYPLFTFLFGFAFLTLASIFATVTFHAS